MIEIIPAIMPKSYEDLVSHMKRVRDHVPLVQVDIMDGKFVEGVTWPYTKGGEEEFGRIARKEERLPDAQMLEYEIDLMIKEPERVIENWMRAGASRIIVHIESTEKMEDIIRDVSAYVTRAKDEDIMVVSLGIAINTTTPPETIDPYVPDIDFVQCMGIAEIGKQGEPYDPRVLEQLRTLRERHPTLALSVDGSVHLDNASELVEAGADRLVSGSEIFGGSDVGKKIEQFHAIVGND